jgi:mannose-1-phosphate guanylyltransferase
MKALILAAGKGTRVMPLTRDTAKPMLRILDTPVLELLIDRLRHHGITEIVINTSHHAHTIEQYFGDGRRFGVEIAYSFEGYLTNGELVGEPLGSAGALRHIQRHAGFFDDTFLVLCGDAVVDIDFAELVTEHHRNRALATIALAEVPRSQVCHYGVAVLDESGIITGFQEKPAVEEAASTLVNTGIYVFEPQILNHIPDSFPADIGSEVFPALAEQGLALYGARLPMTWLDIGRLPDFYRVSQLALLGQVPGYFPPGREIAPGLRTGINVSINPKRCRLEGPIVVAGGARVEDGATLIGPCFVGAGAVIEAGARVERSIILPHARIGRQADLRAVVTDGQYCMSEDGTVIDLQIADLPWVIGDARMPATAIHEAEQRFLDNLQ